MQQTRLRFPMDRIRETCERYGVRELALFGSASRGSAGPHSDIDLLVEFAPDEPVGFLTLARLRHELADLLGRPVDLVPKAGLKPAIREEVLASAEVVYAPGGPAGAPQGPRSGSIWATSSSRQPSMASFSRT